MSKNFLILLLQYNFIVFLYWFLLFILYFMVFYFVVMGQYNNLFYIVYPPCNNTCALYYTCTLPYQEVRKCFFIISSDNNIIIYCKKREMFVQIYLVYLKPETFKREGDRSSFVKQKSPTCRNGDCGYIFILRRYV